MIIYKVTNKVNNKVYIGKTVNSLNSRKSQHQFASRKNRSNSYFHNALRKYGTENFIWEEIQHYKTEEELIKAECEFIKFYNSKSPNGYNLTDGGEGISGYKHTEETKQLLRELILNNNPMNNMDTQKIHLQKVRELAKSDYWIEAHNEGCYKARSELLVISPSNEVQIIKGVTEFCEKQNLLQAKMSEVSNGNRKFTKWWKCFHTDNEKRALAWINYIKNFSSSSPAIYVKIPNDNPIYFDSCTHLSNILGVKRQWVYDVLANRRSPYNGWTLKKCPIEEYIEYMEFFIKSHL